MTQEQIQTLINASLPLVEVPTPWKDLTPEQKETFSALLPNPSFDEDQRFYLSLWWLKITEEQLELANSLTPPSTRFSGRDDGEGNLYLNADVLSDAINGGRLSSCLSILESLPMHYRPPEVWPVPEEEEI